MEKLYQQVDAARRRLNIQRFLGYLPWCWFAALALAAVAILVRQWLPANLDRWTWNVSWLSGAMVVGLVAAVIGTVLNRHQALEAAIEVDRRFGLRERVSSSLSLSESERATEAGSAVVNDAVRRVDRLNINERFGVQIGRKILLPIIPAAIAFLLAFLISDQGVVDEVQASTSTKEEREQVKKANALLRKKINRLKRKATKGLDEADKNLFEEIEQKLQEAEKNNKGDRKQAMMNLNKLADTLQKKMRGKRGGSNDLRNQLKKMKNLTKGPADKLAKAIKDGKMNAAMDEIKQLQQQLANNNMTDKQKKELAEQLEQMKQKMQNIADAHQQAMNDLKQQIEQAKQSGDLAKAGDLQDALSKLQQQQPQMDQLSQMANKLGKAAKAMEQGDNSAAQQSLSELSDKMGQMQNDMDQLADLETALDEISQTKNAMNCKQCQGQGCSKCQGGQGNKPGQSLAQGQGKGQGKPGVGLGEGQGEGGRPLNENDTSAYDARVRAKIGRGKGVITGQAGGPNSKGKVRDTIQSEFESQEGGRVDPLTNQRLPKSHQRIVKEYRKALDGDDQDAEGNE
ncbi:MAG: hypothetical protein N2C12_02550 [Planctomycetales bacterium]